MRVKISRITTIAGYTKWKTVAVPLAIKLYELKSKRGVTAHPKRPIRPTEGSVLAEILRLPPLMKARARRSGREKRFLISTRVMELTPSE